MNSAAAIDLGLTTMMRSPSNGLSVACLMWLCGRSTRAVAVPLRSAGSYQRDDTGEIVAVGWSCVARCKESTAARISGIENTSDQTPTMLHLLPPHD
ncbi:hypothetical protein KCP76_03355 [Salmonella enterica subsp. enterica serovar Weltevreden]|nr:hypothetical protein KCP76_03355 [Salmonella enterica subsp. enterica serovar Weltevreden]